MPEKSEPPEWFIKYIRIKNTDSSRSIEVQGVIYGFIKAYFAYDGSGWLLYHRKPFN
jgi:hypothetical protein